MKFTLIRLFCHTKSFYQVDISTAYCSCGFADDELNLNISQILKKAFEMQIS